MTMDKIKHLQTKDFSGGQLVKVVEPIYLDGGNICPSIGNLNQCIGEIVSHNHTGSIKVMFKTKDVSKYLVPQDSCLIVDLMPHFLKSLTQEEYNEYKST